jgi:hypothetical protein
MSSTLTPKPAPVFRRKQRHPRGQDFGNRTHNSKTEAAAVEHLAFETVKRAKTRRFRISGFRPLIEQNKS